MADIIVSKSGHPGATGTQLDPVDSYTEGIDRAYGGDRVLAETGNYNERIIMPRSGDSENNPITIGNVPGHTPVLDGSHLPEVGWEAAYGKGLVEIKGKHYISFDGLNIRKSPFAGILAHECAGLKWLNSTIDGTGLGATWWWKCTDSLLWNLDGRDLCKTGSQEGFTLATCDGFELGYIKSHDLPRSWRDAQWGPPEHDYWVRKEAIDCKSGCKNGTIHHCETWKARNGIYIDAWASLSENIDLYNNIAHNIDDAAFAFGAEQGGTLSDIRLFNSLCYNSTQAIHNNYQAGGFTNCQIINNTLIARTLALQAPRGGSIWTNMLVRNNILVGSIYFPGYNSDQHHWDHNLITGSGGHGQYITGDPMLTAGYDLKNGSPCIGAGSSTLMPAFDYYDNPRTQADMGAIAYGSVPNNGNGGTPTPGNGVAGMIPMLLLLTVMSSITEGWMHK